MYNRVSGLAANAGDTIPVLPHSCHFKSTGKYSGSGIPHNWDTSFGKFSGIPNVVDFLKKLPRQGQIDFFKYECQQICWSTASHHWM